MWNPREVRGLITQISGIIFGLGGIALMIAGVKATGKINISSSILSGEIESGSAGLLMLFFSFLLIALPGLIGKPSSHLLAERDNVMQTNDNKQQTSTTTREIIKGFVVLFIGIGLTFSTFIGGQHLSEKYHLQIGGFLVFLGYGFDILTAFFILAFIIGYLEDFKDSSSDNSKKGKSM